METIVHLHFVIRMPGDCDTALASVYRWLPWVLLREHFRRAGVKYVTIHAEAS